MYISFNFFTVGVALCISYLTLPQHRLQVLTGLGCLIGNTLIFTITKWLRADNPLKNMILPVVYIVLSGYASKQFSILSHYHQDFLLSFIHYVAYNVYWFNSLFMYISKTLGILWIPMFIFGQSLVKKFLTPYQNKINELITNLRLRPFRITTANGFEFTNAPQLTEEQIEKIAPLRCAGMKNNKSECNPSFSMPDTCSICLEDYDPAKLSRQLPCKHTFHAHCITNWLNTSAICPICRKSLMNNL